MKRILPVLFLLLIPLAFYAQIYKWAEKIGGLNTEIVKNVTSDSLGNSYAVGIFYDTVDFDPGPGISKLISSLGSSNFIFKLDQNGNYRWAFKFGSNANINISAIGIDPLQNIILSGSYSGTVDFNPGIGVNNLTSTGNSDVFVEKLDSNFNFIWVKSMGGIDEDVANALSIDKSGNIYTTGYFNGIADYDPSSYFYNLISKGGKDIFISKLNSSGGFEWAAGIGGVGNDQGITITTDRFNNPYITGSYELIVDFDPTQGVLNLSTGSGTFLLMLKANGDFIIARDMVGNITSTVADDSKNIYITGYFSGIGDFDPGFGVNNLFSNGGSDDIFILRIDSFGNVNWVKQIGGLYGDYSNSIKLTNSGEILITGSFEATTDFDPGSNTFSLTSSGFLDAFILRLNTTGGFLSACSFGGADVDEGIGIAIDQSRNITVIGLFNKFSDFDPDTSTSYLFSDGYEDIFIARFCLKPLFTSNINGPTVICKYSGAVYSTSPVSGATSYQWSVPANAIIDSGQGTTSIHVLFGSNAGNISVAALNSCGGAPPSQRLVTALSSPLVHAIVLPSNKICDGTEVTLKGSGAYNYSWSGGIMDGISFTPHLTSIYILKGYDLQGCFGTDTITIVVEHSPGISFEPSNQFISVEGKAIFICSSMDSLVTYQWQQNSGTGFINISPSQFISGINNDTLIINKVSKIQNKIHYRCLVTSGNCTSISKEAILNICDLEIIEQPKNIIVTVGNAMFLDVNSNISSAKYEWMQWVGTNYISLLNNIRFIGANQKRLILNNTVPSDDQSKFMCVVRDDSCVDTTVMALVQVCNLKIITQPINQIVDEGLMASFNIITNNNLDSFQWQQNSGTGFENAPDTGQFLGSKTNTLKISNVIYGQNNFGFRCLIFNQECIDSSSIGRLFVNKKISNGIINNEKYVKTIYPNPVKNLLHLTSAGNYYYTVLDATGKEILTGKTVNPLTTLDLNDLDPGIYMIVIENEQLIKFIKL